MAIANLLIKIGADISELKTGSDAAIRSLEKTGQKIDSIGSSIKRTLGAAFTVGAVVSFGQELLRMGDDIVRTADRTGLLTDEVQKLSFIASQSGNTIEELTSSIGQMQNRLASGDKSAVGAVKALGLSFDTLRSQSPYDQLASIAEAVAKIPNPATRAQVAMDLFGRSGIAILPTLTANFKALGDEAPVMSEKTTRALEQFGDAFGKFTLTAKVFVAELYNKLGELFDKVVSTIYRQIASLMESIAGVYSAVLKVPGSGRAFPGLADDIKGLTDKATWFKDAAKGMEQGTSRAGDAARKAVPAFAAAGDAVDKLTDAQKKAKAAAEAYAKAFREGVDAMKGTTAIKAAEESLKRLNAVVASGIPLQKIDRDERAKLNQVMAAAMDVYIAQGQVVPDSIRKVHNATLDFSKMAIPFAHDFKKALIEAGKAYIPLISAQARWSTSIADWPRIIQPAKIYIPIVGKIVKSTDDWARSIGVVNVALRQLAQISSGSFAGIVQGIGTVTAAFEQANQGLEAIKKNAEPGKGSGKMGSIGALAAIATGYGAVAMAAIAAGKAIFKAMNDGRKAVVDFATSSGGFDDLRTKLLVLGDEGERLWLKLTQGTKKGDKAGAEAAVAAITQAFEKQALAVADATSAVASLISASLGSGVVIPPAVQASIDKLIEMGRLTRENASDLLGLSGVGVPSLADVTEAADRYGLKLKDLGPKIDQLQITSKADQIIRDWELLSTAGADVGTVMAGMTSKVQPLVDSALKFGRELPDSMRPLLQKMAEAGLLTDATGTKLEDLSTITFTVNPIDALILKLDELISKITSGVGGALENLGKTVVHVPIKFDVDNVPDGVPGYAGGTRGRLLDFGSGTLAMLHGRERIVTENESLGVEGGGDTYVFIGNEQIDARTKKVTRQDAARGGLKPRAAHGRSY